MRINFDVATFGEKGTEHGMLDATSDDVPDGLVVRTDLPIDLPESEGFEPMIAGFAIDGSYVFLSTIRDATAKRAGMAKTVALFAATESIVQLDDLSGVVAELERLQKGSGEVRPIEISAELLAGETSEPDNSAATIFNALADEHVKLPVVWEGLRDFSSVLIGLWRLLPAKARPSFHFRVACRPSDGASQDFDLVCSPTDRVSRWVGHRTIGPTLEGDDVASVVSPLRSQAMRKNVYSFAGNLGVDLGSLRSLPMLTRCYATYADLSEKTDLEVTTLFRTIGRLSPKPNDGQAIKTRVCEALVSRVKNGPPETLMYLRNLSVDAYRNGRKVISRVCEARFYDELADSAEEMASSVQDAILAPKLPWSQGVLLATKRAVDNCLPSAARVIARLFGEMNEVAVADWIEQVLATNIAFEDCLILHATDTVCENSSTQLLNLCKRQDWTRLHARVGHKLLPPAELMRQHATIASDLSLGAEDLSTLLGPEQFALESSKSEVEAYWGQVAKDCEDDGDLFALFDYLSGCWRYVFCHFVERSLPLPRSIEGFNQNVFLSWEAIAAGELSDSRYVHALAESRFSSVLNVPDRELIWDRLESTDCDNVLEATAEAWLQTAGHSSAKSNDLEPLLRAEILASGHREKLLPANAESSLRAAIDTFNVFDELGEEDFAEFRIRYLTANLALSEANASRLGAFIEQRGWWRLAKALLNDYKTFTRNDLLPALQACRNQFSMFTRYIHGLNEGLMPEDGWWAEAVDVLSVNYSSGPSHNSLWSRAGGEPSELPLDGSGKDRWALTLALLRRGRDPKQITIGNLLWQVQEDGGPTDQDVRALIDHCPFALDLSRHQPFVD